MIPLHLLTAEEAGVNKILPFPSKIQEADFVIITCALTPSSLHLINEQSIALMKDGVYIVNVSRGKLIDEPALIAALESKKVKAAALDVFEEEPLPAGSHLRRFDQCIFGSHNGSNTVEGVKRATEKAISILFNYLNINLMKKNSVDYRGVRGNRQWPSACFL
jgi:D-3-phosphoglycerate dehydrogenase